MTQTISEAIANATQYRPPPEPWEKGYSYAGATLTGLNNSYSVKNLIPSGVSIVFGESQAMKSFVTTDIAWHVATGQPWCGNRVKQQGVLVFLGEGQEGFRKRMVALKTVRGGNAPIWVHPEPVNLMTDAAFMFDVLNHAENQLGQKIGMVVFDTLSLMLGDGDENAAKDTAMAFSKARSVFEGRSIVFVHHSGHGDKTRERGSYQIQGNADSRILVTRDDTVVTVRHKKSKDDRLCEPVALEYRVVELGTDADGDEITSLVLEQTKLQTAFNALDVDQCQEIWRKFAQAPIASRVVANNSPNAALKLIAELLPVEAKANAKAIMNAWISSGVLVEYVHKDQHRHIKRCYVVDRNTSGGVNDITPV